MTKRIKGSCTSILVGKKASINGSTIISRNDDGHEALDPERFVVVNPKDQPKHYQSVMLGSVIFFHKKVLRVDIISFALALIGVVLLITRGDLSHLSIPFSSVLWGIGSGITAALYIVIPQRLIAKHNGLLVTGWGMLFAGIFSNFFRPMWVNPPHLSTTGIIGVATVILLSNVIAFLLMVFSTKYTTAATISITDAVQPFTTLVLSVLFLSLSVNFAEVFGAVIVVFAIYVLNRYDTNTK